MESRVAGKHGISFCWIRVDIDFSTHVILRTILAAIAVVAVILYYRNRDEVPTFCVALVAASLMGHVFLARTGNLFPFFRAWLMGGAIAAFVYPLDSVKTDAYDIPSGMSYVAAFVGCLIAGFWSLSEGRSFWNGRRHRAEESP